MGKRIYTDEQIDYVVKLVTRKRNPLEVTPATREMCKKFELKYTETVGRSFRKKCRKWA